jgi:hypothetical protein
MDGDKEFRFISFNVPTLNIHEDELEFTRSNSYALPDEYELRDVFETVRQLGGHAVRLRAIPMRRKDQGTEVPSAVEAPGKFSEESFKVLDLILALANEYQVRVIIPIVDQHQTFGGRAQYAEFRGKPADDFWTDPVLIDDFKATIRFLLNRRNTVSGVVYKDDKAILCWETGNELKCPPSWTTAICSTIKSIDKNHLTMDGACAIDDTTPLPESSLTDPSVDILSSHHHNGNPTVFSKDVQRNLGIIDKRKPYIVSQLGTIPAASMETCLKEVVASRISGTLILGLSGHRSKGGFYWHSEYDSNTKACHWPGFDTGAGYDEKNLLSVIRRKAFEIRGEPLLAIPVPRVPVMLPVEDVANISWKGSAGASSYEVFRSEAAIGPWTMVGYDVDDSAVQYHSLFNDNTAQLGKSYYYHVVAKNSAGRSKPSRVVGPVSAQALALIDDMNDFGKLLHASEGVSIDKSSDRDFREDLSRAKGSPLSEIVYCVPGKLTKIKVFSFGRNETANLELKISQDSVNYTPLSAAPSINRAEKQTDNTWYPILYELKVPEQASFLKILFCEESEIGRVELHYQ